MTAAYVAPDAPTASAGDGAGTMNGGEKLAHDRRISLMRHRARGTGLKIAIRGDVCHLRDAHGEVFSGPHDAAFALIDERHAQRPTARAKELNAWQQVVAEFTNTLVAAGYSNQTVRFRREQLEQMGNELDCALEDITGAKLVAWMGSHRAWKSETRRSMRTAARQFFKWAAETGRLPSDVGVDLPKVRQRVPLARPAPDQALRLALMAADPRMTLVLRLAAEVGLRRAEIAQVRGCDLIDGIGGPQLLVHGKGDKPRIVPLSDDLASAIRARASAAEWVFPARDGQTHLTPQHLGDLAAKLLPDHWTLHTLRHRFASRAYRGSRNLRAVQALLGHSSIATTERYLALDEDEVRAAMMAAQ